LGQEFPERVGRYEVLLPIASGGMATVYLARSRGTGGFEREVALERTHSHLRENSEFADDLLEEAKLAARIRHGNVVSVLDVGSDPLGLFLVMDYVEGDTLASLRKHAERHEKPIPYPVALRILVIAKAAIRLGPYGHEGGEGEDRIHVPGASAGRSVGPPNRRLGGRGHCLGASGRAPAAPGGKRCRVSGQRLSIYSASQVLG